MAISYYRCFTSTKKRIVPQLAHLDSWYRLVYILSGSLTFRLTSESMLPWKLGVWRNRIT